MIIIQTDLKDEWKNWRRRANLMANLTNLAKRFIYRQLTKNLSDINSILELGAGSGIMTKWLQEKYDAKNITLVDNDRSVYKDLKRNFPNATVLCQDVLKFKFNKKFDIVHSGGLLEHFFSHERDRIIDIHCKYAKKYVLIFTSTYNLWFPFFRLIGYTIEDEFPFTRRELLLQFKNRGFKLINEVQVFHAIGMSFKRIK